MAPVDPVRLPSLRVHQFNAVAFVENFSLRELAPALPGARMEAHALEVPLPEGGRVHLYAFGALTFHGVAQAQRDAFLARVREARNGQLSARVVAESFTVREEPGARTRLDNGVLYLSELTEARAGVVALLVAQSAAMEYYERLVDDLFGRTDRLVDELERRGTVGFGTRKLHRFIGEAVGARNEVLSVLHLLDKPDEVWDDPELDRIYSDLRSEFDLVDRFQALERKQHGVQEALELVLDVARDRRMSFLEYAIALMILVELALSIWRH